MTRLLHNTKVREALRGLRPYYNAIFRRKKDYNAQPTPVQYLKQMEGRGVFLLCFGRSGSTVFADFLGTHPQVMTFGEVLGEESYYSYFQWLSRSVLWVWALRPTQMAHEFYRFCAVRVGKKKGMRCLFDIKIESLHLIEGNWRLPGPDFQLFHHLRAAEVPVILLTRKDLVARYVSGQVAERRGAYHSYHGTAEAKVAPFSIDIDAIKNQIAQIEATHAAIRKALAGHPRFVELAYEDLFVPDGDTGNTRFRDGLSAEMAACMGVDDKFDSTPRLQKMSGKSGYSDIITNWPEVKALQEAHLATVHQG